MSTSTMELSMENMELANGGFSPLACVLGTIFGAGKGALAGGALGLAAGPVGAAAGALGLAAGPVGAAAGALVGGIVGGAVEGYAMAFIDERGGKKQNN